jgi:hypothetical protein
MRKFEVDVEVRLTIVVNDESIIDRCVENHDSQGVPQPDVEGGMGWRNTLYDLRTAEAVIEMLAYNYVVNDAPAHKLDGWADLEVDWRNPYAEYRYDRDSFEVDVREVTPTEATA